MSVLFDKTPVPQAATVEIGTDCTRNCLGCAFDQTLLDSMSAEEMQETISTLSKFWDHIKQDKTHQLIGEKIVELLGGAGQMNRLSRDELRAIIEVGKANKLSHIAFLCDAEFDGRAIREFFQEHAASEAENPSGMKAVIALSVDSKRRKRGTLSREHKSNAAWKMLEDRDNVIVKPELQNFRVFTTISKQNLDEIPCMERRILESGALLFVAPLTIHSDEVLAKTGIEGRLLMGTDTKLLLTEDDKDRMERAVDKLRKLKSEYPNTFLNNESTFENMIAACKPLEEAFVSNCRERCEFTLADGQKLNATPNFRVMRRPDMSELSLGICTCFVGPVDREDNYANTPLSALADIAEGKLSVVDVYQKLTRDLVDSKCPGCNCRTSIDIVRGQGLK